MLANAEKFFELGGFPGVVGAVDGTHIGIKPPKDDARAYKNRKGNYTLNVQVNKTYYGNKLLCLKFLLKVY